MNTDYQSLLQQAKSLIQGEPDIIANLANLSAILYHNLDDVNWAGFYLLKGKQLVLGPFQGQPACIRIPVGRGVCGNAAATRKTQLVFDVHKFEGHIACDVASNSEVVIPIMKGSELLGVLDIDSPSIGRFSQNDVDGLTLIVEALEEQLV